MAAKKYLSIKGPQENFYGYGNMTVSLQSHLPKEVTLADDASTVVFTMLPNMVSGWYKGQRRVIFTMWETTELPPSFYEELSQFDQVIVPCKQNREIFLPYHDNVSVVPLGIDPALWPICDEPSNETFTFVTGGSNWWRKGLDIVLDAFIKLDNPNTRLIMKLSPDAYKSMPKMGLPNNVTIHTDWMSQDEEYKLYSQGDCFVSASRGEGFGLIPLQVMSMGVPTIISDTTGHQEFSHLATHALPCSKTAVHPQYFYQGGLWDEVDTDELVIAMSSHVKNKAKYRAKARQNALLAQEWTWDRAAQCLVDAVNPGGKVKELVWEPALEARVFIVCNRNVTADVNDRKYSFVKGEEYLVPTNVKRVIAEAGYLKETWLPPKHPPCDKVTTPHH